MELCGTSAHFTLPNNCEFKMNGKTSKHCQVCSCKAKIKISQFSQTKIHPNLLDEIIVCACASVCVAYDQKKKKN